MTVSAMAALRVLNVRGEVAPININPGDVLRQWVMDKGYDPGTVIEMARRRELDDFLRDFMYPDTAVALRNSGEPVPWNYFGTRFMTDTSELKGLHAYNGQVSDDISFRTANTLFNTRQHFVGEGARASFESLVHAVERDTRRVSIAVIGGGAAGIMTVRSLYQLGFTDITLYSPDDLGIWDNENVYEGSRNNPRELRFIDRRLDAAPGDGDHVRHFLSRLFDEFRDTRSVTILRERVTEVIPGNLKHVVRSESGDLEYPIVINAMGTGDPKPMHDPERMTLYDPEEKISAVRWQKSGLEISKVAGTRYIFVGLGNSTAEMIRQLHEIEDQGYEVDYRILTHYPLDSIMNPTEVVISGGKGYRVFRDLSQPNLTSFQGDLPHSRQDYFRALLKGRIIPGVMSWTAKKARSAKGANKLGYTDAEGKHEITYDKLMVLTGYQQNPEKIAKFGCCFDSETKAVRYDYDGELVGDPKAKGPDRLHRGYFAIGAVADAPHNRNAIVIPGMISSLPPLLGGVVMRASQFIRAREAA